MTDVKKEVPKQEVKAENPKKAFEATYTIAELMEVCAYFKTTRVVVKAALAKAGKEAYTLKEAKEIIDRFKSKKTKEVRA